MEEQNKIIQEILDFNFTDELNLDALPQEEQDEFNRNLFTNLIERIIKKTGATLPEDEKEQLIIMVENGEDMQKIFEFLAERNENFFDELGKEFIEFKTEIFELLN